MPEPLWIDLMALQYFTRLTTCSAIADALDSVSPDRLTRMRQETWSGHILLALALRALFPVAGGALMVDDTWSRNPPRACSGRRPGAGHAKTARCSTGCPCSCWSGPMGITGSPSPSGCGVKGGASLYALALELLSYARHRLKCQPRFVLFDSWYPSKKVLKRIKDYGWYFVCQLKRNRSFEGRALRHYLVQP